jgi:predicted PurR-regulated permease PerM
MEQDNSKWVGLGIELLTKLGALAILIIWCYRILEPFLIMIVWGMIIAVATFPLYDWLRGKLPLRDGIAAALVSLLLICAIIVPVLMITDIVLDGSRQLLAEIKQGDITIPLPPDKVKTWPVIGETLWDLWYSAATDLVHALEPFQPQLKAAGKGLLQAAGGVSFGVIQFVFSIVVAGALLAHSVPSLKLARRVVKRLMGDSGPEALKLVGSTIRSVTTGILGVAFIQAVLAGFGFAVMGIPMSGLLTLVCLILCIVQLGVVLVAVPLIIYVFSTADTTPAVLFTLYMGFVMVIDNVLKPLLLGRGVKVPMLIIFVGAIGGFLASGIIGLFVGAVILVLAHRLSIQWLKNVENRWSDSKEETAS